MARSRKKTPITGITLAESEKEYKVAEHRRERRAAKQAINTGNEPEPERKFGDPWKGPKDGRQWWNDATILRK